MGLRDLANDLRFSFLEHAAEIRFLNLRFDRLVCLRVVEEGDRARLHAASHRGRLTRLVYVGTLDCIDVLPKVD